MPPSYPVYVYECEICHGEIRVNRQDDLPRCLRCGKEICSNCSHLELCKADFDSLPQREKDALNQIEEKYKPRERKAGNMCAATAFIFIAAIVIFAISVPFRLGDLLWLPVVVGGVGTIMLIKWVFQDKAIRKAKHAARKEVVQDFMETFKNLPLDQLSSTPDSIKVEEPVSKTRWRICAGCGRELRLDAEFCDKCGQKVPKLG